MSDIPFNTYNSTLDTPDGMNYQYAIHIPLDQKASRKEISVNVEQTQHTYTNITISWMDHQQRASEINEQKISINAAIEKQKKNGSKY